MTVTRFDSKVTLTAVTCMDAKSLQMTQQTQPCGLISHLCSAMCTHTAMHNYVHAQIHMQAHSWALSSTLQRGGFLQKLSTQRNNTDLFLSISQQMCAVWRSVAYVQT